MILDNASDSPYQRRAGAVIIAMRRSLTDTRYPQVRGLEGKQVHHLVAGYYHTLCLVSDKDEVLWELYAWGCNTYGQLGLGHTHHQSSPMKVLVPLMLRATWCSLFYRFW